MPHQRLNFHAVQFSRKWLFNSRPLYLTLNVMSTAPAIDAAACDLLADAAQRGAEYVRRISTRRVAPTPDAVDALAQLSGPLPEESTSPHEIVDLLDRIASPAT